MPICYRYRFYTEYNDKRITITMSICEIIKPLSQIIHLNIAQLAIKCPIKWNEKKFSSELHTLGNIKGIYLSKHNEGWY